MDVTIVHKATSAATATHNESSNQRYLRKLEEIKNHYELEANHEPDNLSNLNSNAFLSNFSDLFWLSGGKTSAKTSSASYLVKLSAFATAGTLKERVDDPSDPILQEIRQHGLDSQPLEIIISGLAHHVNSTIGRLMADQRLLDSDLAAFDVQMTQSLIPKITARHNDVKALNYQTTISKTLGDLPQISQSTRECFDKVAMNLVAKQARLPHALQLSSERIIKKYPLLSSFLRQSISPSSASFSPSVAVAASPMEADPSLPR